MATRSTITIKNKNNEYESIYCHYDGYPDGVGKILVEHYKEVGKIEELINLGDISILEPRVNPRPCEKHSFDRPADGVTVAYNRDRGPDYSLNYPCTFKTEKEMIEDSLERGVDYLYLFENGEWMCLSSKKAKNPESEWKLVRKVLEKDEEDDEDGM